MEGKWDQLRSSDPRKLTTDGLEEHLTELREYQNILVSTGELQIMALIENGTDVNVEMVHTPRKILLDLIVRRDRVTTLWLNTLRTGKDDEDETRLNREAVSIKKFKNAGAESATRLNVTEKQWEEKMIERRKQERKRRRRNERKIGRRRKRKKNQKRGR